MNFNSKKSRENANFLRQNQSQEKSVKTKGVPTKIAVKNCNLTENILVLNLNLKKCRENNQRQSQYLFSYDYKHIDDF